MTTEPRIVSWDLTGGIATKNAPLMVQPPSQLFLDNVRQERANEWRTRAGTSHSVLDDLPGATAPLMAVNTPTDGFVALVKQHAPSTACEVYSPSIVPRWHAPPLVAQSGIDDQQACCQQSPVTWDRQAIAPAKGDISAVTSAVGDGYRLSAWWSRFANSGVQVAFSSVDGTNLQTIAQLGLSAANVRPRAVYSGAARMLVLVWANPTTGEINAARWDTTTGLQIGNHLLSNDANLTDPYIDARWYGGDTVTIAFRNQSTGGLSIVEYNPATNVRNEYVPGVDASKCVSLFPDPDATGSRFVGVTTAVPQVRVLKLNATGGIVTNDVAGAFDATNIAGCAYSAGAGWMIVAKQFEANIWAVKKVGATVSAPFDLARGVGGYFELASNAWRESTDDAMRYLLISFEEGQETFSEFALEYNTADVAATVIGDRWPEPQARMLPLNASLTLERGAVPQVFRQAADVYITALGRVTRNIQASAPGATHTFAVDAWTATYLNESNRYTLNNGVGTTTQTDAFLPAGILLETATGALVAGHGASAIPFQPVLTASAGAGSLLLKRYTYGVTVEMPDENGLVWRSPMSLVAAATLTGGENTISAEFFVTPFENLTRRRIVKLWRTDGDGSVFKLLTFFDGGILDTLHITYLDLTGDVGTGEPYFGELEATLTPGFRHVKLWNGRMWGVPRDFPAQVWFSKPLGTGFLPEFPGEFVVDLSDAHGDITNLEALDDKIVALKEHAIYVAGGDGPGNDGSGAFPSFQLINSESGSIPGSPVVSTGAEVYFVSLGGLFWVTRAQEVQFIGAAIDAYLSMPLVNSPETVIGMVVAPGKNEVRVQTTNYRFVHDRIFNVWERDTGGMTGSSGIVATRFLNDLQVLFTNLGAVWYEASDSNTPDDCGVTFQGRLRSPWMRPSGMEGWVHLYQLRAVAECLAAGPTAQPTMACYYDNDDSLVEYFSPRVTLGTPGPVRANARPRRQLCTAFSPQMTLPAGNASIRFDSWSALVATEPATQPVGGERNWISGPVVAPTPPAPTAPCGPTIYPGLASQWRVATVFNALHSNSAQDDSKDFVFQFTTQMITFGWLVRGSSDSVTAGMDGVNRITNYLSWTRPGDLSGPFSWLCLENGAGAQVVFAINTDDGGFVNWAIKFAPGGGYTGGSINATPTAPTDYVPTDYTTAFMSAPFNGGSPGIGGIHRMVARVMVTTDVKKTRIACMFNGVLFCMMGWETVTNPVTGWAHPNIAIWDPGGNNPSSPSTPIATESQWRTPAKLFPALTGFATGVMPLFTEIEGANTFNGSSSVEVFPAVNALSGAYQIPPAPPAIVNYDSYSTSGQSGRHATFSDLYVVPYGHALGSSWPPGSTDNSFNVFGNFIMPGDGNPVVTS